MSEMSISPISAGMPRAVEYTQASPTITQSDVARFEERLAQADNKVITVEPKGCSHLQGADQISCEMRMRLDNLIVKNQEYNNPYLAPSSREVIGREIRELQGGLESLNRQVDSILEDIANRGNRGQLPAGDYNFGSSGFSGFGTGQTGQSATMWNGGEVTNPYAGIAEPKLGGGDELRQMIQETERRLIELQWATRRLDPPPQ